MPPFFVLSTDLFCRYAGRLGQTNSTATETSVEETERALSEISYGNEEMPARFWLKFDEHLATIRESSPNSLLAVRSSAVSEDQVAHSFAGQFSSILHVQDRDAVWTAVKECWLSLWQANVKSYQLHSGRQSEPPAMAVIVQKMVPSKASGVLFTQEPVSGDDTTMLLEIALDTPDGVVSGHAEPLRAYLQKESLEVSWGVSVDEESEQKLGAFLSEGIQQLGRTAKQLEAELAHPQDIEWAFDGQQLWLLQSRPMTTPSVRDRRRKDERGDWWTDHFFTERFAEPVSPLGWSVLGRWITKRAFSEPLACLGYDDLSCDSSVTRLFDSRPFTRLDVFQSLYSVVPLFAISDDKRHAFFDGYQRPFWLVEFARRLPYLVSRLLVRDVNWIPPLHLWAWARFLPRYLDALGNRQKGLRSVDATSLHARFLQAESLTDEFLSYHRWSITFADLFFHLLEYLLQRWAPDAEPSTGADLISGIPGNRTVEANLGLSRLASLLAESIAHGDGLTEDGKGVTAETAMKSCPEFQEQLHAFLETHGHRSHSLDLLCPTWRDNPDFLLGIVTEMSVNPEKAGVFEQNQNAATRRMLQAESQILSSLTPIRRSLFRPILKLARSFALLRENQRYYWHMALAEKRRIALEVGKRLVQEDQLNLVEDVFFLTRDEFLGGFGIPAVAGFSLRGVLQPRKQAWKDAATIARSGNAPSHLQPSSARTLHGIGVSTGMVQARAAVVHSLNEAKEIEPGSILVTNCVDPAWTPVFTKIAGLVLEVGGILSHASIIAREFRLPAVTSVRGATSLIADKQPILVDGTTGKVEILLEKQ